MVVVVVGGFVVVTVVPIVVVTVVPVVVVLLVVVVVVVVVLVGHGPQVNVPCDHVAVVGPVVSPVPVATILAGSGSVSHKVHREFESSHEIPVPNVVLVHDVRPSTSSSTS